jgi:hypothetical protein
VQAEEILINGVLAGAFTARAQRQEDMLSYRLDASVLEGQLQAAGELPTGAAAEERGTGSLTLTGVRFSRLGAILRDRLGETGLDGLIDLHATYEHDAENFAPSGSGAFVLRAVELAGFTQIDRLEGDVSFTPEFVRVENVAGGLSGGRIQASATYRIEEQPTGEFLVNLRGADAERFLAIWLDDVEPLTGRLDLNLRGRLADGLRMSGSGQISRAEAGVLSLGTLRSPVLLEISRTSRRGRLSLPRLSANLAGGRIAGNFDLAWGYGLDLDTKLRFDKVDLPRVLNEFGAGSNWAAGKLTGSLSLKGRNIRSTSDLNGSFEARLRNVQALKLPVLSALRPYTGGVSFNKAFKRETCGPPSPGAWCGCRS